MSSYFDALNRRNQGPGVAPANAHPPAPPAVRVQPPPAPPVTQERAVTRLVAPPTAYESPRARPIAPGPYEGLRERLLVAANGKPLKTIVFAGCRGGEGCTRVVHELAHVLAASGLDIMVIDADRRAGEHAGGADVGPDLAEYVETGGSPAAIECGAGRLALVPRCVAIPDKDNFYRAPDFGAWIAQQRGRHDYILLDAPPLLSLADATLLGRVSDGAVIVARAEVTERETLVSASQQLERAGVRVVGVVLNGARDTVPGFLRPYLSTT